jgi:hypothetical protein
MGRNPQWDGKNYYPLCGFEPASGAALSEREDGATGPGNTRKGRERRERQDYQHASASEEATAKIQL